MFFLVIPDFPFVLMSKSRMSASSISSCISILILHCLFLKQKNTFKTGEKDLKEKSKIQRNKDQKIKNYSQFTIYNLQCTSIYNTKTNTVQTGFTGSWDTERDKERQSERATRVSPWRHWPRALTCRFSGTACPGRPPCRGPLRACFSGPAGLVHGGSTLQNSW